MSEWTAPRETDEQLERRLIREGQECYLGTLIAEGVTNREDAQRVRVEVTYADDEDIEHGGYFLVYVPEIAMTGDEEFDLAHHPATLANDKVTDWGDEKQIAYQICDTFPA